MVDPISASYSPPPTIRFTPDPGEPAVDVTATPRQTAFLVTAQEQRNETRLRTRALLRGEDVLYSHRTFTQGNRNGYPVYNAGLTTVVSRDRPANPIIEAEREQDRDNRVAPERNTEKAEETSPQDKMRATAQGPNTQDIERDKRTLDIQQDRVENKKEQTERQLEQAMSEGDLIETLAAKRKVSELERKEERIDREKRKVELDRLRKNFESAQQTAGNAVSGNLGTVATLLGASYGGGQGSIPSSGTRLDLFA